MFNSSNENADDIILHYKDFCPIKIFLEWERPSPCNRPASKKKNMVHVRANYTKSLKLTLYD